MTQRHRSIPPAGSLRVLYSFPHPLGGAGIGWTAWNQVQALIGAGHTVDVFAADVVREVPGARTLRTTLTLFGRRIPHRALGGDNAYRLHDRIVSRAVPTGGYDVVHTWPLAARRTLDAARRAGIAGVREAPNTHTAHAYDVVAAEIARLGLSGTSAATHALNPARLATEEAEWNAATAVLVASEHAADTFVSRGHPSGRLLRHRYGCAPAAAEAGDRGATPGMRAVFVGRGEPRKGLHHALSAWRESGAGESGTFDIYGHIVPEYREALTDLLAQPGVRVHGFTADPAAVFANADVLILPSLEEGSALVTYEAQAAGCVLLVSDAAGAWLRDGEHGLVHPAGAAHVLREHIARLAGDPALRRRMSAAAAARRDELTWTAAGTHLVAAYREAIAMASGSASTDRSGSSVREGGVHALAR